MKSLIVGSNNHLYSNNRSRRNKYSIFLQPFYTIILYFNNLENVYFLVIGIFQLLTYDKLGILPKHWSPTGPFSTTIPLLICLIINIINDLYNWISLAFDDYQRNNTKYKIFDFEKNQWYDTKNKYIYPGNVIFIKKNTTIPLDCILIDQFEIDYCKCSLANLNGESNITTVNKCNEKLILNNYNYSKCFIEKDNKSSLFEINGTIMLKNNEIFTWNETSLLVNGSKLVSDGAIALVINCGNDKKINNSTNHFNNYKYNSILTKTSQFMMEYTIYVLICLVSILSIYNMYLNNSYNIMYLLLNIIQNWILLNGIIPFSIKILLNFLKILQSKQISNNYSIIINNPNIIDQFGFIDRIYTDKTGTLTKNCLELVSVIDYNKNIYNLDYNVHTNNENRYIPNDILQSLGLSIGFQNGEFLTPEDMTIHQKYIYLNSKIEYSQSNIKLELYGKHENYEKIEIKDLEFSVNRPLSSNIFRNKDNNEFTIFSKGSIHKINSILKNDHKEILNELDKYFTNYDSSLRMMALAKKRIPEEQIIQYFSLNKIEQNYMVNEFEQDMELVSIIGIRDTLYNNVDKTIKNIKNKGIGIGLLTGDRKITALTIAKQANIYDDSSILIDCTTNSIHAIYYTFNNFSIIDKKKTILIIDMITLNNILLNPDEFMLFEQITLKVPNLIGCSLTPLGKKTLVDILESNNIHVLTLGDGYNDISMSQSSNISIGVKSENVCAIKEYTDICCDNFTQLDLLLDKCTNFSISNQILSIFTMFKCCSIAFIIFWFLLIYNDKTENLFTFSIYQGFHLIWCLIHPIYLSLYKTYDLEFLKCRRILVNFNSLLWMALSFLYSLYIINQLNEIINTSYNRSFITFHIILLVNISLFIIDYSFKTFMIQFINFILFALYVNYFDVGLYGFLTNYFKFLPEYLYFYSNIVISEIFLINLCKLIVIRKN